MSRSERRKAQTTPFSLDEDQKDPVLQRRAKWVQPDEIDDELKLREEYQREHKGKWGELVLSDDRIFQALEGKKAKEEYLQYLKLGQQLVDPKDPLSQQRAFQVVPELKSLPEQQFDEDLAMQEWIRILLRDGAILGPEDHKRMMLLMRPEQHIPIAPVWDLDGSFSALFDWAKSTKLEDIKVPFVNGEVIFNPTQWAINKKKLDDYLTHLIPVKIALLRRVYPGCRAMDDMKPIGNGYSPIYAADGESYLPGKDGQSRPPTRLDEWYDECFVRKESVITGQKTTNKYIRWWDGKIKNNLVDLSGSEPSAPPIVPQLKENLDTEP